MMKISNSIRSLRLQSIFAKALHTTSAFALVLVFLAPAVTMARELNQASDSRPESQVTANGTSQQPGITPQPSSTAPQKTPGPTDSTPRQIDSGSSTDDYKNSLKELSSLYESEVKRLTEENNQLKQLYIEGLIARVELEASDKALAEAQSKVEGVHKQIAEANLKSETFVPLAAAGHSDQIWTTGSKKIDNLIRYYGNETSIDPYLIFCLMSQESSFDSGATSPKGALGLMQLMPATAARYGVTNPYDSAQSIMGGAHYLKDLLQLFGGRLDLALAGYNAGENAVIKYGYKIPPYAETQAYVHLISARYAKNTRTVPKT